MILQDSSEPDIILKKIEEKGGEVKRNFNETGDYLLNMGFAIERKKGRDLIGSLQSKRLFTQLNNLVQYENPILALVTSNKWKDFYFSRSRYIHSSYNGLLTTIMVSYPKLKILQFEDDDEFVDFIVSLDRKLTQDTKSTRPVPIARKPTSIIERKENCLAVGIERLGIERAKKLLECFGSIKNIANASEDELRKVEGIGETLVKNIIETLN